MKLIILLLIKLYWLLIPKNKRKHCVFKESCSKYIYRITNEKGFIHGVKSLRIRMKKCKPGYYLMKIEDNYVMILCDGSTINEDEISPNILNK